MLIHEAFVAADMKTPHIPTDPLPTSPRPESQALIQSCQGDPFPGVLCAVSHLAAFMMQCSCSRAVSGEAHGPMRSQALLLHSPPAPGLFLPTLASIKEALATGSWASHTHPCVRHHLPRRQEEAAGALGCSALPKRPWRSTEVYGHVGSHRYPAALRFLVQLHFFSGTLWLLASQIPYFPTQHLHTQNVKGIALSTNKENRTQMRRKSFAACFSHPWPSVSPQMEHPGPP